MTIRRLIHTFGASACLLLLTGCSLVTDDEGLQETTPKVAASYINLTIAVTNGNTASTRAGEIPASGEDGNGREAGFDRENAVTGITLILYRADNGINTAITETVDPVLEFVRYYPVKRVENATASQGTPYDAGTGDSNHNDQFEAQYTTGNQPISTLGVLSLDLDATYHAIVVANLDLTGTLKEKQSKLSDVKDYSDVSVIYSGSSYDGTPSNATNFVMSSEEDNTLRLSAGTLKNLDGTAWATADDDSGKDKLYDLTNQPLMIERMAARIDFWAKGADYLTKSGGGTGTEYGTPGYVYKVWKTTDATAPTSTDRFVLTSITPFNLNNGNMYLLKHLSDGLLKPETGSNYVLDPTTKANTASPTSFVNTLTGLSTTYAKSIKAMHDKVGETGGFSYSDGGVTAEDVIVCYPKENTLPEGTSLYYNATGLVIEGDYYFEDNVTEATKKKHLVYYTYIRHQGEGDASYDALTASELSTTALTTSALPMNYGIVRNNIYRVYVDKVMEQTAPTTTPKLKLLIKVKKWDKFVHTPIYM